jgi:thiol-disulfide isomerase/thioredoxin
MEKITNTWNEMSMYMKAGVFVLVAVVLYFLYTKYLKKPSAPSAPQLEGMQSFGSASGGGEVVCTMYYTDSCPHCVKAKPEWNKFEEQYNGQVVNGKKVLIAKINCQEQPEIAEREQIAGFPTFKFAFNGKTFDYNDERVLDNFVAFLQRVSGGQ